MKEYHLNVNGHDYVLTLKSLSGDRAEVEVAGDLYTVDIHSIQDKGSSRRRSPAAQRAPVAPSSHAPATPPVTAGASPDSVSAPIPGAILEIYVAEGDSVEAGADLLKMEAMKMENRITAPRSGKIGKINVKAGEAVAQGQVLIELE